MSFHVDVFLQDMKDFEQMNAVGAEMMGEHRPARTVIGVHELPKPGVLLTMNLTVAHDVVARMAYAICRIPQRPSS
jgi:enamine deaminase RidA (YjgF/YER057c/UK114 family)